MTVAIAGAPDAFQAIAHPTRRALLDALAVVDEQAVRDLATRFESSRPAISQHLRVLKDAGLVTEHRSGRENVYSLSADPLRSVATWANGYERFWADHLRALGALLDERNDQG